MHNTQSNGPIRKFFAKYIYRSDFEADTPQRFLQIYFQQRELNHTSPSVFQILGLGIAAVISGEFTGWNAGLRNAGYYGFWIANALSIIMYLSLAACLAEMSLAMPGVGGMFSCARNICGDFAGFLIGMFENLEYCTFVSLLMLTFGDNVAEMAGIDQTWKPLIWFIILLPCGYIIGFANNSSWNIMLVGTIVCILEILAFCIAMIPSTSVKEHLIDQHHSISPYWGTGWLGVGQALITTAWWFTGLECVTMVHETKPYNEYRIKQSLYGSWAILTACAVLLSIFNVLVPPGFNAIALSSYPMVEALTAMTNPEWKRYWILVQMPSLFVNMVGMLWCATRQTWALSRSSYLPQFISITETHPKKYPLRSLILVLIYSYLMALAVQFFESYSNGSGAVRILLNACLLSAGLFYIGIAMVFLVFRTSKYTGYRKPYKSPFGQIGAALVIIIALVMICAMFVSKFNL